MSARHPLLMFCVLGVMLVSFTSTANSAAKRDASKETIGSPVVHADDTAMRVQGEQRFRANCGRCHAAPEKFSPRVMKTVIRHMRVRAAITDEDMKMILFYMTQ